MRPRPRLLSLVALAVVGACADDARVPTAIVDPRVTPVATIDDASAVNGYTVYPLAQAPTSHLSAAFAINSAGVAVGYTDVTFTVDPPDFAPETCLTTSAAIFANGQVRTLHRELLRAVGGWPCGVASVASGINDRGEVVGTVWHEDEQDTEQGFFWSPATGVVLHQELGPTFLASVNNHGVAVGFNRYDGLDWHDFVWSPVTAVPPVERPANRDVVSWGINDAGRTAGCLNHHVFTFDASGLLRHNGDVCGSVSTLLPAYDRWRQEIGGINAAGTVVYTAWRRGAATRPVRWSATGSATTDVGWAPGAASAISDRGQVIGWRSSPSSPRSVAMTVGARGQPTVLPTLGSWTEAEPYGLNACGDIVGAAFSPDSSWGTDRTPHAVVWRRGICDRR